MRKTLKYLIHKAAKAFIEYIAKCLISEGKKWPKIKCCNTILRCLLFVTTQVKENQNMLYYLSVHGLSINK